MSDSILEGIDAVRWADFDHPLLGRGEHLPAVLRDLLAPHHALRQESFQELKEYLVSDEDEIAAATPALLPFLLRIPPLASHGQGYAALLIVLIARAARVGSQSAVLEAIGTERPAVGQWPRKACDGAGRLLLSLLDATPKQTAPQGDAWESDLDRLWDRIGTLEALDDPDTVTPEDIRRWSQGHLTVGSYAASVQVPALVEYVLHLAEDALGPTLADCAETHVTDEAPGRATEQAHRLIFADFLRFRLGQPLRHVALGDREPYQRAAETWIEACAGESIRFAQALLRQLLRPFSPPRHRRLEVLIQLGLGDISTARTQLESLVAAWLEPPTPGSVGQWLSRGELLALLDGFPPDDDLRQLRHTVQSAPDPTPAFPKGDTL